MQAGELATHMKETMPSVHSVTVEKRQYRVYQYEGPLNGMKKAVVLLSYPNNAFGDPATLRAFLCTDCSMDIEKILGAYMERWPVEVFFRESKQKLGLDQYQIRSSKGIWRFWLMMSLVHFICCTGSGQNISLTFIGVG